MLPATCSNSLKQDGFSLADNGFIIHQLEKKDFNYIVALSYCYRCNLDFHLRNIVFHYKCHITNVKCTVNSGLFCFKH